ncbi:MAG TPA: tRNA (N6-threonylcarbamoyladenosine(37)-N6)-methyltransferase TrmO [Syntrophomonas sp.]|nr:tRNA (N6-threonylcarbamoyladenosine(37)-N6)-methyltransferase TrmO [Syntrophomonas sp.]
MDAVCETGINLQPIGIVRSPTKDTSDVPIPGKPAEIVVDPRYSQALCRIETNSHLWILSWFHLSNRESLVSVPARVNPYLPQYGVFSLRSPNRPNPIGLSLVRLQAVDGNVLKVTNLDAIDGTPVLDIKPYYEQDIVFSPATPYIRPYELSMRRDIFLKQALTHHQEECDDLYMAVRMALIADEYLGQITLPQVFLQVSGSTCLADTLQGLSRARLANPARFRFTESGNLAQSIWETPGLSLRVTAKQSVNRESFKVISDEELFEIVATDQCNLGP